MKFGETVLRWWSFEGGGDVGEKETFEDFGSRAEEGDGAVGVGGGGRFVRFENG